MRFAQIVVTDQQALMARYAIDTLLADENHIMTEEERADFERLAVFLGQVATSPVSFPVTGKTATRLRKVVRADKGLAQPSRKPKRHARREARQGRQKFLRRHRREFAQQFNVAREKFFDGVYYGGGLQGAAGVCIGTGRGCEYYYFSFEEGGRNYYIHGSEVDWSRG